MTWQMLSGRHREVLERLYPAIENGRNSDPHSKSSVTHRSVAVYIVCMRASRYQRCGAQ